MDGEVVKKPKVYPPEELALGMNSMLAGDKDAFGGWNVDFMKQSMEYRHPGRALRQMQLAEFMRERMHVMALLLDDFSVRGVQTLVNTAEWSEWPMFDEIEEKCALYREHREEIDAAMKEAADAIVAKIRMSA